MIQRIICTTKGTCKNEPATKINAIPKSIHNILLKKLTEVGDPIAKRVFQEEIAKRFASCSLTVIHFLLFENYLDYLSEEELDVMFKEFKSHNQLLFLKLS